ncbi:MAG TPA: L-lactate dehydrogenase [Candidatus Ornithomonoglobus merdipullorum]|uniref:L-lactate dehydrogenase n=1 Tax=Candidatus Ornithomonoglobus merdipullorum TaxID=2840895 RepID=A0A9D1MAL3_9FIRM|nr:L-lactate dehydrogenase [Candidatus Ornithomonoglobus merdipullorum]
MRKFYNKVVIIGCGAVGASIAYALSIQGTVSKLVLIDVNRDKAEGEVLDIGQGMLNFTPMEIYCGDYNDVADCDLIIVASGVGRRPGDTRLDLAKNNINIIKSVAENIKPHYNGAVILMVANPVDILTYVMYKELGIPSSKIFGTGTSLDTARFKYFLSQDLDVCVNNVHGYIIGEHGDSQFPVLSSINIAGTPFDEYCESENISINMDELVDRVKHAGAEVIKKKHATYYAIASTVCRIVNAVVKDEHAVLPVSTVECGSYGLDGVSIGLPCIVNAEGINKVLSLRLSDDENEKLKKSAATLKSIIDEAM